MLRDNQVRVDVAKLGFLSVAVMGLVGIFILNPALSTPSFLALMGSMILSPWVAALERKGLSRIHSSVLIFAIVAITLGGVGYWATTSFQSEWSSFREKTPEHFQSAIHSLRKIEENTQHRHPFLSSFHPTDSLLSWGQKTGKWFVKNGATWVQSFLTWLLLVPPITFVLLNEGRSIRRRFFALVPNRYFESFFFVSSQVTQAISDYLRAKLVEAVLVGMMVTLGLVVIQAPYALVLGLLAGLTNILPYAGPVIGAVPALLVAYFDSSGQGLLWPIVIIYGTANLVDMLVIFPLVVAKLVNLHPLLLIAVVAIGQEYYGLIGMLISIPIASACKVIIGEVYFALYEQRTSNRESRFPAEDAT
jgi:putative permease